MQTALSCQKARYSKVGRTGVEPALLPGITRTLEPLKLSPRVRVMDVVGVGASTTRVY